MKAVKTTVWDPAAYLETEEDIAAYLEDVFSTNDAGLIVAAIGDVARARGMSRVAEEAECGRESLYKSLSATGNPSFETILKVLSALGYSLKLSPVAASGT
ncbi:MAG: putative addiction module antidote protein [Methylobacteriaceae bacterium]|jgi:probable addiction module antidote protein|nr:putative addiction module antidote protein [Methylobacteriaceae bacterium]